MIRNTFLNGLGAGLLALAATQGSVRADQMGNGYGSSPAVQAANAMPFMFPRPPQVVAFSGYRQPRLNCWNGVLGPGVYFAPRGCHHCGSQYNNAYQTLGR